MTDRVLQAALDDVCVVMMSAVGDAIHVLPVINALRRHRPATRIAWVLQPVPASLVRGHVAVNEIIERQPGVGGWARLGAVLGKRRFDLVIDLQVALKAGVATALARAPVKLGFDRARARDLNWMFSTHQVPPHPPQHVQDQYFEFLQALGVPGEPIEWLLGPWENERPAQREFFSRIDRPVAALAIGSSNPNKDWVAERWATLASVLYEEYDVQPVLVGGVSASERRTEATVLAACGDRVRSALGSGLRPLVGILDGSAVVISLDTAPLHMAVALGRPVVSLMGYTNPKRTGPYRWCRDLVVDAYGDPGEDYPVSMQYRPGRMARIQVADVLSKVERWKGSL